MPALPRSQIGGQSGARFAARFFIDALSMWVGELLRVLSILKMAERRGSPSTPAPLQYLSLKAPFTAYEAGWREATGWLGQLGVTQLKLKLHYAINSLLVLHYLGAIP